MYVLLSQVKGAQLLWNFTRVCTVERHPVVKFYPNIKGIILKAVPIISKDYLFHYLLYILP